MCSCAHTREGPARGGSDLRILVAFSQIRAPYRAIIADVSPRLSDQVTTTERNERRGSVKVRRLKLFALNQEVVRQFQLWRHRRSSPSLMKDGSHSWRDLRTSLAPFIMAAFTVTQTRSPARLAAQIHHVSHTSRKALGTRMPCTLQLIKSSSLCMMKELTAAYHHGRPRVAARGSRIIQEKRSELRCPTSLCTVGRGSMQMAALERLRRGLAVISGDQRLVIESTRASGPARPARDQSESHLVH